MGWRGRGAARVVHGQRLRDMRHACLQQHDAREALNVDVLPPFKESARVSGLSTISTFSGALHVVQTHQHNIAMQMGAAKRES